MDDGGSRWTTVTGRYGKEVVTGEVERDREPSGKGWRSFERIHLDVGSLHP